MNQLKFRRGPVCLSRRRRPPVVFTQGHDLGPQRPGGLLLGVVRTGDQVLFRRPLRPSTGREAPGKFGGGWVV
jgi:hypothetical protein